MEPNDHDFKDFTLDRGKDFRIVPPPGEIVQLKLKPRVQETMGMEIEPERIEDQIEKIRQQRARQKAAKKQVEISLEITSAILALALATVVFGLGYLVYSWIQNYIY